MAKKNKMLKLTQIKSSIGHRSKSKQTLEALGLGKMQKTVVKIDSPQIRGMVNKVSFLLKIEEL
tara:strand:+ start:5597 stop:5788 length:192 start_codon:yes stop_codon:yes gene_type:complete